MGPGASLEERPIRVSGADDETKDARVKEVLRPEACHVDWTSDRAMSKQVAARKIPHERTKHRLVGIGWAGPCLGRGSPVGQPAKIRSGEPPIRLDRQGRDWIDPGRGVRAALDLDVERLV